MAGSSANQDREFTCDERTEAVLTAVSDPKCRAILRATAESPSTANELSAALDLPLSTVYRKLNTLTGLPLLEERTELARNGKHPQRYHCPVGRIHVTIARADDGTDLELTM